MNTAPSPVFEVRSLQVIRGGSLILNIPSLVVTEGEILVLIGPNGAGKSTLLQTLSAVAKPSRGEIFFRGQKIGADIPLLQYRRKLAMVLQEPLLFDTTVYNNVASGLKIRGMKRNEIEPIVAKALERFGIAHLKDRSARTLSGGEARRASIARAFATNPEVLLLDEPFSALDPIMRETLIEDLEKVLRETRITTIFVTHDRMEAIRLATRLGVMNAGEILQTGSPDDVMNHPANEFVASLVGVENLLHGRVIKKNERSFVASVSGQDIEAMGPMQLEDPVILCIRPENVMLSGSVPGNGAGAVNTFPAHVVRVTPMGPYQKVQLNCGFQLVTYITSHALSALSIKQGTEALASFDANTVHVISKGSPASSN
ncbi:MAG: ABC transporter ATP-binding protein [Deltaproteobacteria bacterium]|jgi:tungstate transport system ATP-binding protein|nr:ABC transporter ATP-binding protein [Deltaproteobacteria bacterium]